MIEDPFFVIILGTVFGTSCAIIAHSKGRNPLAHFLIGFFIGCIGLVIILCLSNLKEEKARLRKQESHNRMLREQLRQEQIKVESLRQHTTARLDSHDTKLGIQTRNIETTPGLGHPDPAMLSDGPGAEPEEWFYLIDNKTKGPISRTSLVALHKSGQIDDRSLVFHCEWSEWKEYGKTTELRISPS